MDTLIQFHRKHGALLDEYEECGLPIRYGSRLDEEIQTLLEGAGIFEASSCLLITVLGPDALEFLQGMVTSNVKTLEPGQVQASLLCGSRGKIQHRVEVIRIAGEQWIVSCAPGEGILVGRTFDSFHIREDLELGVLNQKKIRIDIIGPESAQVLQSLGFKSEEHSWNFRSQEMLSISSPLVEIPHLINLVPLDASIEFMEELLGEDQTGLVGQEALGELLTHLGLPRFGIDYGTDHFPQEASLGDHISYDKGCYVGQEPHARMYHRGHPNRILVGLMVPERAGKPSIGADLYLNSEQAGQLTSLSSIRKDGICRGIGMIRHSASKTGMPLTLEPGSRIMIEQWPLLYAIK